MELKSFFRYLGRNKTYTLINVIGFALSLAFVILTMAYTWQESTVDHFHKDADRIQLQVNGMQVESGVAGKSLEWAIGDALPPAYWLKDQFADIEDVCPVILDAFYPTMNSRVSYAGQDYSATALFAEKNFFTFFSYPLLVGDSEKVLQDPYAVVVSESFARKVFGTENPVGKSFRISDSTVVTVAGVMENFKRSIIPYMDMVLCVDRVTEFRRAISRTNQGDCGSVNIFVKMYPGHDMNAHHAEILDLYRERYLNFQYDDIFSYSDVRFLSLKEIYFSGFKPSITGSETKSRLDYGFWGGAPNLQFGDRQLVTFLWVMSAVILLFSVVNYINLSMMQATFRYKEAATRRLVGASQLSVRLRLLWETFLVTLISYLLAFLLALSFESVAMRLLQKSLDISWLYTPSGIGLSLVVVLLISLLAGFWPSFVAASASPIEIVNGACRRRSKSITGKIFIGIQNAATFVMLTFAVVSWLQIRFMVRAPLGYNVKNVLLVQSYFLEQEELLGMANDMMFVPGVSRVGVGVGSPFDGGNNETGNYNGRELPVQYLVMDSVAFDILDLKILNDNRSVVGEGYFMTRYGFDTMGLSYDATDVFLDYGSYGGKEIPICGMIDDFKMGNVLEEECPFMVWICRNPFELEYLSDIFVEVEGDLVKTYLAIEELVRDGTDEEVSLVYMDQQVQSSFEAQIRFNKITGVFSGVALLVSLLGLVAMSVFYMRQRLKEVAVRKVFGADNGQVFWHLVKPFMACVGIGILLGLPLAWYLTDLWISGFSYRVSGIGWLMALVAAFCLLVSFAAVGIQGRIASRTNPAENIKTE